MIRLFIILTLLVHGLLAAPFEDHWAFRPPTRAEIPKESWGNNTLDKFIAAKNRAHNLTPNPPEDPARLIRRLTLDLTGLPPSPQQVASFREIAAQDFSTAVELATSRLLATDEYAEHFARHWLHATRYSDTPRSQSDASLTLWPYRDWVIRAFRQNMPFDQFTREQIAGDLLPNATPPQRIATGFHRALSSPHKSNQPHPSLSTHDDEARYADDQVAITSAIWLGLSAGCAACHDHKSDPISQRDFYALSAFFRNTSTVPTAQNKIAHAPLIIQEKQGPAFAHLLEHGEPALKKEKISADLPTFFRRAKTNLPQTQKSRLDLAEWLVSEQNPLTARVTANRIWAHFFGRGIVATTQDFGTTGAAPTHPQLLDTLALELLENNWDLQHLITLITSSATYQQSGLSRPLDPAELRDLALATSGLLVNKVGGPSVTPYHPTPPRETDEQKAPRPRIYLLETDDGLYRRSLYTSWEHASPPLNLAALDTPTSQIFCLRQPRPSSSPTHSAANPTQLIEASRLLATKALKQSTSFSQRLDTITMALIARTLNNEEQDVVKNALDHHLKKYREAPIRAAELLSVGESKPAPSLDQIELAAWSLITSQMFNLHETRTK